MADGRTLESHAGGAFGGRESTGPQSFALPASRFLPTQQSLPHVIGVIAQGFADAFKRKEIASVAAQDPLLGVPMHRQPAFTGGGRMFLKATNGILQHSEHQHMLGTEMKAPAVGRLVLRLNQDIRLKNCQRPLIQGSAAAFQPLEPKRRFARTSRCPRF